MNIIDPNFYFWDIENLGSLINILQADGIDKSQMGVSGRFLMARMK